MNESRSSSKNFSNIDGNSRISSDDSSLFTSSTSTSSSPSSSCASSRSTLQKKQFPSFHKSKSVNNMQVYDNIKEKEIALRYNKNVGTYSLLICLLVMIFCGKVFAIVCTSTWLYFAPRCFKRIDSEEYKRNVIVEGFFERSHNRLLQYKEVYMSLLNQIYSPIHPILFLTFSLYHVSLCNCNGLICRIVKLYNMLQNDTKKKQKICIDVVLLLSS